MIQLHNEEAILKFSMTIDITLTIFDYIFSKLTGGVYTHQKYSNFQFDSYMTWVGGLSINCH